MLLLFLMYLAAENVPASVQQPEACRNQRDLVGPCYPVRGRMNLWNGTPSVRIWVVGTKRILGVVDRDCEGEGCSLPEDVSSRLSWNSDLFGVFEVCPITHDEPGVMRLVCVASGTKLTIRRRSEGEKE